MENAKRILKDTALKAKNPATANYGKFGDLLTEVKAVTGGTEE